MKTDVENDAMLSKNKNDENVKHGRLGGLFANKITYITVKIPTSLRMLVMI